MPLAFTGLLGIAALVFYGMAVFILGAPIPASLAARPPEPVPKGWKVPSGKNVPAEAQFVGTWRPGEVGRRLPLADGTPNTLSQDQTLLVLPDHTFRFSHQPIYNGASHLICLRSATGSWSVTTDGGGHPVFILNADFASIRIDQAFVPPFNRETAIAEADAKRAAHDPSAQSEDATPNWIEDEVNSANCSATNPNDHLINLWRIAIAPGGRLGIFRDAPAEPYIGTLFPFHTVEVDEILYVHDLP